jgi:hypothetical protein
LVCGVKPIPHELADKRVAPIEVITCAEIRSQTVTRMVSGLT